MTVLQSIQLKKGTLLASVSITTQIRSLVLRQGDNSGKRQINVMAEVNYFPTPDLTKNILAPITISSS